MATKIIKLHDNNTTYVPVTLAKAVQFTYNTNKAMSVQEAIEQVAGSALSISSSVLSNKQEIDTHVGYNDIDFSYTSGTGVKISGVHTAKTKILTGEGLTYIKESGNNIIIGTIADGHAQGVDNQHLSASVTSNVGKIALDGGGGEVKLTPIDNPAAAGLNVAHVNLSYSSTDGLKLKVTYTDNDTKFTTLNKSSSDTAVTSSTYSVSVIANQKYTGDGTSMTVNSYSVPTQYAVDKALADAKQYADEKVGSAIHYMGNVPSGGLPTSGVAQGDAYRVNTPGTYADKPCEVGDILINTSSTDTPSWTILQNNLDVATSSTLGTIKIGATADTTNKKYPVELNSSNQAYVAIPWVDEATTYAGHYTPSANNNFKLSKDATNGTATTVTTTSAINVVTGVDVERDGKGHITNISLDSAALNISYTDTDTHVGTHNLSASQTSGQAAYITLGGSDASKQSGTVGIRGAGLTSVTYTTGGDIVISSSFNESNEFGKVSVSNAAANTYSGPSTGTTQLVADVSQDVLNVKGENYWIHVATSESSNNDTLNIGHALSSAGAKSTSDVYSIKIDAAGHITEATAAATGTVGINSLSYSVSSALVDDFILFAGTWGSETPIAELTGDTTFVK